MAVGSDNPTGGDDQQETGSTTRLNPNWVCGFVDGEGCFSVAVHRNPHVRKSNGWQFCPTFQVAQHEDNREVLEALVSFFGTGRVRSKGRHNRVLVYTVYGVKNAGRHIVPFFEAHSLIVKAPGFERFAAVVSLLQRRAHFTAAGVEEIARLAYGMNGHGKQRSRSLDEVLRGSSETVREARATYWVGRDETVRAAWRHAELGRNDLAALN